MLRLSETFQLDGLTITALSDGVPDRGVGGFFAGVDPADWTQALGLTSPDAPVPFNFGSFLLRGDGHTTLIDSGNGARDREMNILGGGELLERLAELGVRSDEVDRVAHTHLHGDHCGWNIGDDAGGAITFPNAIVYVAQREPEYWTTGPPTLACRPRMRAHAWSRCPPPAVSTPSTASSRSRTPSPWCRRPGTPPATAR